MRSLSLSAICLATALLAAIGCSNPEPPKPDLPITTDGGQQKEKRKAKSIEAGFEDPNQMKK